VCERNYTTQFDNFLCETDSLFPLNYFPTSRAGVSIGKFSSNMDSKSMPKIMLSPNQIRSSTAFFVTWSFTGANQFQASEVEVYRVVG
jgi:hypothetical protein